MEGRPLDEEGLVDRARNGDASAYTELVRAHQSVALRVAYLVLRDATEAQDAAQEAFVKAYHALHRFRPQAEFRPWLLRIVRNEALNRRRSAGRRARLMLKASADPVLGDAAPSPETEVVRFEEQETWWQRWRVSRPVFERSSSAVTSSASRRRRRRGRWGWPPGLSNLVPPGPSNACEQS